MEELEEPTIESLVFQALGEASMCWSETPKGVFDSVNAKRIGNELVQAIKEWARKQPQEMDGI